jgi:hypothetical protein
MENDKEKQLIDALEDVASGRPVAKSLEALKAWRDETPEDAGTAHVENCHSPDLT